jgi:hypothetical protein
LNDEDRKKRTDSISPNATNLGDLGYKEQPEKALPNGFNST